MPILHFGLGGRERAPSFAKDLYILYGNVMNNEEEKKEMNIKISTKMIASFALNENVGNNSH